MVKKSTDGKVKFYDASHKYKLGKTVLTSGTTFLKDYFQPFDAKAIARKLAKFPHNKRAKRGVRYWLAEWKQAAVHGTQTHQLLEDYFVALQGDILEEPPEYVDYEDRSFIKAEHGSAWLDKYWESVRVLKPSGYAEYIIYNEDMGVAGQIDLLVERMDIQTGEEVVDLIDWKTNKKIDGKNYEGLSCFEPLTEFESSTYLKYQLQLSLYAYMLELKGKKIGRLVLVHLKEDKSTEYEMEYRPDLIEKLIEWRKTHGKTDDR